jgi:hypothetical protein
MAWRTDRQNAPQGAHEFFIVRVPGLHPARATPFTPQIVQQIEGELFAPDDEINPLLFVSEKGYDHDPETVFMRTNLEWQPFPEDWK